MIRNPKNPIPKTLFQILKAPTLRLRGFSGSRAVLEDQKLSGTYEAVVLMTVTIGTAVTSIVLCLGILCKSLLVAMAKELEQRALQALLPHDGEPERLITAETAQLRLKSRTNSL